MFEPCNNINYLILLILKYHKTNKTIFKTFDFAESKFPLKRYISY